MIRNSEIYTRRTYRQTSHYLVSDSPNVSPQHSKAVTKALKSTLEQNKKLKNQIGELSREIGVLKGTIEMLESSGEEGLLEKKTQAQNRRLGRIRIDRGVLEFSNQQHLAQLQTKTQVFQSDNGPSFQSNFSAFNRNYAPSVGRQREIFEIVNKQLDLLNQIKDLGVRSDHDSAKISRICSKEQNQGSRCSELQSQIITKVLETVLQSSLVEKLTSNIENRINSKFGSTLFQRQKVRISQLSGLDSDSDRLQSSNPCNMLNSGSSNSSEGNSTFFSVKSNLKKDSKILQNKNRQRSSAVVPIMQNFNPKKVQIVDKNVNWAADHPPIHEVEAQAESHNQTLSCSQKQKLLSQASQSNSRSEQDDCREKLSELTLMINGSVVDLPSSSENPSQNFERSIDTEAEEGQKQRPNEEALKRSVRVVRREKKQVSLKIASDSLKRISCEISSLEKKPEMQKRFSSEEASIHYLSVHPNTRSKRESQFYHETQKMIRKRESGESKNLSVCGQENSYGAGDRNNYECVCRSDYGSEFGWSESNRSMSGLKRFQDELLTTGVQDYLMNQSESFKTVIFSRSNLQKSSSAESDEIKESSETGSETESGQNFGEEVRQETF